MTTAMTTSWKPGMDLPYVMLQAQVRREGVAIDGDGQSTTLPNRAGRPIL